MKPNCAEHRKDMLGVEDMEVFANLVGNLHYESLYNFLCELSNKLRGDAQSDYEGGRFKLSDTLLLAAESMEDLIEYIHKAKVISEPFMPK